MDENLFRELKAKQQANVLLTLQRKAYLQPELQNQVDKLTAIYWGQYNQILKRGIK